MSHFSETFPANTDEASIPANLREMVNAKLMDGETIRWIDQPIPYFFSLVSSVAFGFGLYLLIVTTIILTAIASGEFGPPPDNEKERIFFLVAMIPNLLVGLGLLSAPLWTWRKSKRIVYALTNLRVIIVQRTFSTFNIMSYCPADFSCLSSKQRTNGTGNLCFRTESGGFSSLLPIRRGFWNIRNVGKVECMLQELKGKN